MSNRLEGRPKYPDWNSLAASSDWRIFLTDPNILFAQSVSESEGIRAAEELFANQIGEQYTPLRINDNWVRKTLSWRADIRDALLLVNNIQIRIKGADKYLDPNDPIIKIPEFGDKYGKFGVKVGELIVAANIQPNAILQIANRPAEGPEGGIQVLADNIERDIVVFKDGVKMLKPYHARSAMGGK